LLDDLHKRIGDDVTIVSDGRPRRVRVVGTVFSPTSESTDFNGEVVLTKPALDASGSNIFVEAAARVRPGVGTHAVLADLDARFPYGVSSESPARAPGSVRNLEQISRLPLALAIFFALLGAAAVGQALVMTAADRRRDIGVLRALGFTRRQVTEVNAAVATSVVVLAIVLGVPLGVLAGKLGWSVVANDLYIAPEPLVPVLAIAIVGFGLLAFANLVAIVPARLLARRPPSTILRAE